MTVWFFNMCQQESLYPNTKVSIVYANSLRYTRRSYCFWRTDENEFFSQRCQLLVA